MRNELILRKVEKKMRKLNILNYIYRESTNDGTVLHLRRKPEEG